MQEHLRPRERTHMLDEIREQPEAVRRTLANTGDAVRQVAQEARQRSIDVILLAARGTSDHAALYGQYLFQYLNGIPVALATPSLFTLYGASLRLERALVIGISQSGESTDIVHVIERSREAGALTAGITNIEGSPLAKTAQHTLLCHAGLERSVAATKTYTTTCTALAMLAASLPGGQVLQRGIQQIPDLVTAALQSEEHIARLAERYVFARDCVVLGRVFQYCTAREMALKLEETCYIVSTPFSTADFRHGPAALIERGLPVILFATPGRTVDESLELLQLLHERGADCMVITEEERLVETATNSILLKLPAVEDSKAQQTSAVAGNASVNVAELLAPIAYIVPGQLFAQYVALVKGLNPDRPRGLAKVTRTL
ncbi:MAG TPA: SIS domain-containing protein [Ktedonobacteraceae bacterium]|jgi:glucosamine--fructose-6-phosphate aminotransferase (isomerizing)|nr:SIS domain-containing protein [Ktedonobacteraceae bacterium]